MWGESKLVKMACSDSLAPRFVSNGYVTAELTCSTAHACQEVLTWSRVLRVYGYVSSTHKVAGIPAVSCLCPLGPSGEEEIQCPLLGLLRQPGERLCHGCRPSQERISVSAVCRVPQVSFQPLSSHLAYPRSSEH